jgi:cytochrome c553
MQRIVVLAAALAAGIMAVAQMPGALAQVPAAKSAENDELRAAYATAADVAEGKRVAQSVCAGCHGTSGTSSKKGIPHLAGQRPAYLYLELRTYQSGRRGDNAMSQAVKTLSDDALYKVAAYYASLEPALPASSGKGKSSANADPLQAGKTAAAACAGCHGDNGVSKTPGTPSLAGLDPKYVAGATRAYKSGQRKSDIMTALASTLSDADIGNVALYYALQKPARAQSRAAGAAAAGKAAAAACAGCHGEGGVSSNAANPNLAGQDPDYLAAALRAYKDGSRKDETMKGLAGSLDDAAIKALAAYYATLEPQRPNVQKPLTTAEWVQRCDRCHGVNGNSTDPRLPAIAGQRLDYLERVLHAYRTGERKSPQMAAMSHVLSETDVANLAAYYARQRPRAAVYIFLPSR